MQKIDAVLSERRGKEILFETLPGIYSYTEVGPVPYRPNRQSMSYSPLVIPAGFAASLLCRLFRYSTALLSQMVVVTASSKQ
jgi:hypothetical protein